ncbi:prepilin-type N-terminal cleavage/methylation domain-containing protein [bacterium]|nr:prepilin-type N-terminal cleavage/methylation domain-containing protein [bacterium]
MKQNIANIKNQYSQLFCRLSLKYYVSAPKQNFGFTLLEMVAVIAIISILLAIALPIFNGLQEAAAGKLVRYSMIKAYKECKVSISRRDAIPTFTIMRDLHMNNGYYQFFQFYEYIPRKDGFIPPFIFGSCFGPLGPASIGVKKINGNKIGG